MVKKVKKRSVKKPKKLDAKIVQADVDSIGVTVVARLHAVKFGIAVGVISALCVVFTTLCGIFGWFAGYWALVLPWLEATYGLLGYAGANWTSVGLGAIYGFIDGFVGGFVFAWVYNKLI